MLPVRFCICTHAVAVREISDQGVPRGTHITIGQLRTEVKEAVLQQDKALDLVCQVGLPE